MTKSSLYDCNIGGMVYNEIEVIFVKLLKNKWIVLSVGVISLVLAIIMLPYITNLGKDILYTVTAVALIIYAVTFLLKNVSKRNTENAAFWFEAGEIIVVFLIAIGLILTQLQVFNFQEVSLVIAAVVWMLGIVGVIRARSKLTHVLLFLVLTTAGAYFFAKPIVGEQTILVTISVIFFVLALFCGIKFYELHKKSPKKSGASKKKAPKKVESKEESES